MISSNNCKEGRNYSGFTGSFVSATEKPFPHAVADRKAEVVVPVQAPVVEPKGPDTPKP